MTTSCVFCRIVTGEAPADVVAEDERTVAFCPEGPAACAGDLAPDPHASLIRHRSR